jgi:hypothetical protein
MLSESPTLDENTSIMLESRPGMIIQPMPDTTRFNKDLGELERQFLQWAMQQPWAEEYKRKAHE